jgi:hypothetical protein
MGSADLPDSPGTSDDDEFKFLSGNSFPSTKTPTPSSPDPAGNPYLVFREPATGTPPQETAVVVHGTAAKPSSVAPLPTSTLSLSISSAWDRALVADAAARSAIKLNMNTPQTYSTAELTSIRDAAELKVPFKLSHKFPGIMNTTVIKQQMRALGHCVMLNNINGNDVYASAEAFVSGSVEDVASFVFDNEAQFHNSLRTNTGINISGSEENSSNMRVTIVRPNDHSRVVLRKKPAAKGALYGGREFLNLAIWKRVSSTKIILILCPTEHDDAPRSSEFVRGLNTVYCELTEIKPGVTHSKSHFHMNLNGNVPSVVTRYVIPRYAINGMKETVAYFQHLVPLAEVDEVGGRDMGDVMMDKVLVAQKRVNWKHAISVVARELDEFFSRNAALREVVVLHPTFPVMIRAVVEQRVAAPGVVKTKLANLSPGEATRIGSFLTGAITTGVNSDAAVDNWVSTQVALRELDEEYVWFRPFVYAIGLHIINSSNLGMKARVIIGGALSFFDMASDIYVMIMFWGSNQKAFAVATFVMMAVCMFIQVVLVLSATSKMKKSTRFVEVLFVITCAKPAVDAYRVATDWQTEEEQSIDPLQEMALSKCIETVAEAIPASVLQVFALLKAAKRPKAAIASVVISIATTSFTATVLTFDYDTAPKKRAATPEFYGFIRYESRMLTFALLFFTTALHVVNKVLACGLVAAVNAQLLFAFLAVDTAAFLVVKVLRGDYIYASFRATAFGALGSLFERVFGKFMLDFAGLMQVRHPCEGGGMFWSWSMVTTPLTALAGAYYYNLNSEGLEGTRLSKETVWIMVGGITAVWLVSFVSLVVICDPDYRHTFYSTMTARQFTIMVFKEAKTDEKKAQIFKRQFHVWRSIEGEVRTWVHGNIDRWEREKPEWYTKKLVQRIPEEVLTKDELEMLISGGQKVKRKRKSSLLEEVGLIVAD